MRSLQKYIQRCFLTEMQEKPEFIVLVGPPAVGKSTYMNNHFDLSRYVVISRDVIVHDIGARAGLNYDELFVAPKHDQDFNEKYGNIIQSTNGYSKYAYEKLADMNTKIDLTLKNKLTDAIANNRSIIVDMTNLTSKTRRRALNALGSSFKQYHKIAIVFKSGMSDIDLLFKRAEHRSEKMGGDKTFSREKIEQMAKQFVDVQSDEGFNEVRYV